MTAPMSKEKRANNAKHATTCRWRLRIFCRRLVSRSGASITASEMMPWKFAVVVETHEVGNSRSSASFQSSPLSLHMAVCQLRQTVDMVLSVDTLQSQRATCTSASAGNSDQQTGMPSARSVVGAACVCVGQVT